MNATPKYVIEALAEVRESGQVNMLDRKGVTALADGQAQEWLDHASRAEYMQALNDMGASLRPQDSIDQDGDLDE